MSEPVVEFVAAPPIVLKDPQPRALYQRILTYTSLPSFDFLARHRDTPALLRGAIDYVWSPAQTNERRASLGIDGMTFKHNIDVLNGCVRHSTVNATTTEPLKVNAS